MVEINQVQLPYEATHPKQTDLSLEILDEANENFPVKRNIDKPFPLQTANEIGVLGAETEQSNCKAEGSKFDGPRLTGTKYCKTKRFCFIQGAL